MAMKLVKTTPQYSIYRRGDERYAVKDANKKSVNGEAKVRILLAEDLIKVPLTAKPAVEASTEQDSANEAATPEADAPADAE